MALFTVELDGLDLEEGFGLDWFPFEVIGLEVGSLAEAVFLAINCKGDSDWTLRLNLKD